MRHGIKAASITLIAVTKEKVQQFVQFAWEVKFSFNFLFVLADFQCTVDPLYTVEDKALKKKWCADEAP